MATAAFVLSLVTYLTIGIIMECDRPYRLPTPFGAGVLSLFRVLIWPPLDIANSIKRRY